MKKLLLLFFIPFLSLSSYGTHLAGGTIRVICVGGNQFRIQLVKYRDPNGQASMSCGGVTVQGMTGSFLQTFPTSQISFNPSLEQPSTNPCLIPPPGSSLEEYVCQTPNVITLPAGTAYYLYHGDNARNSTNTLTGQSSMMLYAEFPDPGLYGCNNSPIFNENPPMAVCLNEALNYDGSATDPDGDVLQYRFCPALTYPPNSPPFNSAPYAGGFSSNYPVASNPPLAINLNTGLVTGTPNAIGGNQGRYIFNYCVDEYRGGVKIGQYNREVQMTVTSCNTAVSANVGTHYTSIALGVDVIASCDDYTVTFNNTSNGGSTFFWDFGVPGITNDTSDQISPTYTYPDTGTYIVKLVINKGFSCADSVFRTVIVYPTINANFSTSTPACQAEPISFTDQSTMTYGFPIYWSWQFGNGGSSGQQNPNYAYNTPGNYNARLTFESSKGCRDTIFKLVQVASKPIVGGGGNKVICEGASTVLNGFVSPPPPGSTVNWAPATGLSCTNCVQPTASPATNTIYTITATGPTGCTNQATVLVTVTPAPTVNAGPDVYLCGTGSKQLNGSTSAPPGTYQVNWSPATGLNGTNFLNPTASPTTTTSYVLTITTNSGCVVKDTITVHVNSLSVDLGPDTTICPGETVQFNAMSTTSGLNYSWQPASGVSDPTIPNPTATPTTTTTYTVAAINPVSGCSGTDIIVVTVNTPPAVDAGSDTTICVNSSANLQGTGATSFMWDPDPTLSCTNCTNPTASPASTKKYYVTGYDAIGCENRDSVTVTVAPLPNATIAQAPSISICPGDSIQLTASGAGSGSYSWNPTNTLSCGTCSNPYAKPSNNTVYTVMVTDGNNCVNTATVQVNIEQKPAITINQSSPSICEGDTMQLTATPGLSSYSWKPPADIDNPNIPNPKVYPPNTRTYTVTGTNATGCSNTQTVTVTVNQLAPGSFISDTSVCEGGSVQLYANGFTSWQWTPAGSLDNPNIEKPTATPTSTTTYTVNVTDVNGCSDEGTVTVAVNPLPSITVTNPTAICFGDSITLSANGGTDYQWAPVGSLDDPTIANPMAKPNTTTPYTVTVTDGNGCVNTATTTITVNALPSVTAGTDVIICDGDTAFLDAGGALTYQWTGPNLSCTSCETPEATPALTTIYTVEGTDNNGCKNTDEVEVTVNVLQPGNFIPDTAICIGESIQLFANGFTSYQWSPAGSLNNPSISDPIATPTSTTTYEVAVEDANGCQDTGMVTVTVNPLPTPSIQVANDTLCVGTVTTMTASAPGGVSYTWTPGLDLSCSTCPQPTLTAQSSRTYTVEVEDANGCTNTATQSITVMPLPAITKSPDDYVCKYDSTQISAAGGISYQWSPNYRMTCTTCPDPIVYPLQTTNYSVEVTDEYGCVNRDSVEISVNTASSNISPDTGICAGQSTQLQITGGQSYQWEPPAGLSNPNIGNPVASPSSTTEYSVTVEDQNGCRDTGYVTVTVNPLPNVNAGADATICAGQSTNLNASGAVDYSWSPTNGLSNPLIRNPVASPNSTTTYVVTGTDANNCTNTDQITVTVNPLPNTNAGADKNICFGEDTQLLASGADTYNWAPSTGLSCTNCPDPVASPTSTTTYTVTGILPTGCTKTDQVVITVNALPNVTVTKAVENICIGDNVQLSASGGSSYEWTPTMGLSDPNIANPVATPQQTTVYTVRAYNAANCYDETTVTINVASPATIDISADTAICPGETVVLTATGGATYSWSPVGQTGSSITVTPSQGTTYTVDIIDANNCEIQATVDVDIYVPADPMATGEVTICRGDTTELSASNGVTYSWKPSVFSPNASATRVRPQSSTIYTVTIVDNNGCTNTDEVDVTVVQPPKVDAGPDLSIYEGDRALLQVSGASTYVWSPPTYLEDPTSSRTITIPEDTITYYVVGTDAYGCTNVDSITVFVLPKPTFYVPTGFSPNADGQNDEFRVYYPSNFNLISMRVYDRWGNLVFETNDISNGWKGRSPNGDPMPVGTYVYIIEAVDDIGFPISRTGNITLIR